jgi:hypothetical protein
VVERPVDDGLRFRERAALQELLGAGATLGADDGLRALEPLELRREVRDELPVLSWKRGARAIECRSLRRRSF